MKQTLIDTDTLSFFFRNEPTVVDHFESDQQNHENLNISIVTYYEILSGLKHKDSRRQLDKFRRFSVLNRTLPLTPEAIEIASDLYAELRQAGTPVDDMDLLIAGIAIANDLVLVTHNQKHFERINRLELADWRV